MPHRNSILPVVPGCAWLITGLVICQCLGCGGDKTSTKGAAEFARYGLPADTIIDVKEVRQLNNLPPLVQFETVFWEAPDTDSLRQLIHETPLVHNKAVLEIGCGTGLISLCCLRAGAARIVATDINPAAVANTLFNAEQWNVATKLDVRLVERANPSAFAVVKAGEKFDLIISNPPWENAQPDKFESNAFYDPNFALLRSLIANCEQHLNEDGRLLLAYGCATAIRQAQQFAKQQQLRFSILDDRNLDNLPELFLPGMLLEIRRPSVPTGN